MNRPLTFLLSQDFPRRQESATLFPGEMRGAPLFDWRRPLTLKLASPDGRLWSRASEVGLPCTVSCRDEDDSRSACSKKRRREGVLLSGNSSRRSRSGVDSLKARSSSILALSRGGVTPLSTIASREVSVQCVPSVSSIEERRNEGVPAESSDGESGGSWRSSFSVDLCSDDGSKPPVTVELHCKLEAYVLSVVVSAPLWLLNLSPWELSFEPVMATHGGEEESGRCAESLVLLPPCEESRNANLFLPRNAERAESQEDLGELLCRGEPQFCLKTDAAFRIKKNGGFNGLSLLSLDGLAGGGVSLESVGNLCAVLRTLDISFENAKLLVFKPAMVKSAILDAQRREASEIGVC